MKNGRNYNLKDLGEFFIYQMNPPCEWEHGLVVCDGWEINFGTRIHVIENFTGVEVIDNALCIGVEEFKRLVGE